MPPKGPPSHEITRAALLRALAIVYLIAFASLLPQLDGLVGPDGLAPLADTLRRLDLHAARAPITGWLPLDRQLVGPGLQWWLPTAYAPSVIAWIGVVASLAAAAGRAQGPALLACFVAYASLGTCGGRFLSFQWDTLLCEVGFAALLLAPWRPGRAADPWGVWLLRWILFRLMFFAGVVKLTSGDPSWWDGTALAWHYETQPLPNPLSWYAHHLPLMWHRVETLVTLVIELALGLLALGPRRGRAPAFIAYSGLMALLALTGNYGFFQLLTAVLALSLLDDAHWQRALPRGWGKPGKRAPPEPWERAAVGVIAGALVVVSLVGMAPRYLKVDLPAPLERVRQIASSARVVNHYGLFASMTKERPIPILEVRWGDGPWTELTWRWQTSDPAARPAQVAPYMPRLDWQLWFAGLSGCDGQPWTHDLLARVLEGSQPVAGLIGDLRLAGRPPDEARLVRFDYRFSAPGAGDAWWTQERGPVM
ncbi:MAG TPA: lipase maturation factor family protein, partial [Myxococcota bacterium]|nr:lipase maturation factor family protein [Myxococcota bacterium]